MTSSDWFSLVGVLVCLIVSFFFSAGETALTASSRATMMRLAKDGGGARALRGTRTVTVVLTPGRWTLSAGPHRRVLLVVY